MNVSVWMEACVCTPITRSRKRKTSSQPRWEFKQFSRMLSCDFDFSIWIDVIHDSRSISHQRRIERRNQTATHQTRVPKKRTEKKRREKKCNRTNAYVWSSALWWTVIGYSGCSVFHFIAWALCAFVCMYIPPFRMSHRDSIVSNIPSHYFPSTALLYFTYTHAVSRYLNINLRSRYQKNK